MPCCCCGGVVEPSTLKMVSNEMLFAEAKKRKEEALEKQKRFYECAFPRDLRLLPTWVTLLINAVWLICAILIIFDVVKNYPYVAYIAAMGLTLSLVVVFADLRKARRLHERFTQQYPQEAELLQCQ